MQRSLYQFEYDFLYGAPSLKRARAKVSAAYNGSFDWFIEHAGQVDKRPFGKNAPTGLEIKIASQQGIQVPAGQKYATSVTSSDYSAYAEKGDGFVFDQGDDTWIMLYAEHHSSFGKGAGNSARYNAGLRACMEDGIPVGVFTKAPRGLYLCRGLAFVERYDAQAGVFVLHGPAELVGDGDPLGDVAIENLELKETTEIGAVGDKDERTIKRVRKVVREEQARFRTDLLRAYGGKCAITQFGVPETLQAAHISSYFGRKSQMASNGLLLRADLHLLYDAHQISICPDDMKLYMSDRVSNTEYSEYAGIKIRIPSELADRPSPERLETHFAEFRKLEEAVCR